MQERRVVIVGGGPVGLTAALLLARQDIPVTLLERNAEVVRDYRASTFHAATLDLLEECGITAALIRMGLICPVFQYRSWDDGKIAELDLGLLRNDTRHPYRVQCEQYKLSEFLVEQLSGMDQVRLLLGHEAVALHQSEEGVDVQAWSQAGTKTVRGDYVIAADGGRSTVRKQLGIGFPGFTYSERMLVIGTELDFRSVFPDIAEVNYVSDPDNYGHILRIPDMWRMSVKLADDIPEELARSEEYVAKRLTPLGLADALPRLRLRSVYQVHQRVADAYRSGRVFLAGDAAHLNNPKGGMGLNGGLHDAVSLCARLGRVWHGRADEAELDGYERQRRPEAVNAIHKQTHANVQALGESDPAARKRIYDEWRRMAATPAVAYEHLLQTSMIASLRRSGMLQPAMRSAA